MLMILNMDHKEMRYIPHVKKLFEDYERLQVEHAKLRKLFNEQRLLAKSDQHYALGDNNNKTCDDLKTELEQEKSLCKSLNAEVCYLLSELRKIQERYADLLSIIKSDDTQDQINKLQNENKELKDTIEFITSENAVLVDSVKDLEERNFTERREWLEEKKNYEQVVVWSKGINDKLKLLTSDKETAEKSLENLFKFIETFSLNNCSLDDSLKEELKNATNLELGSRVKLYERILENGLNNLLCLNNSNTCDVIKSKMAELMKENDLLRETNKGLESQITELKSVVTENVSLCEVDLKLENAKLQEKIKSKDEMIEKLSEKYARNRNTLEENFKRSTEEIQKLDSFIEIIIEKINNLPPELKSVEAMQELNEIIKEK